MLKMCRSVTMCLQQPEHQNEDVSAIWNIIKMFLSSLLTEIKFRVFLTTQSFNISVQKGKKLKETWWKFLNMEADDFALSFGFQFQTLNSLV